MKNISFKSILFIAFLFLGVKTQAQNYFYVDIDAPAGGNGLTWATAYNNLQDGIDNAATAFTANGTGIVRVSDGVYSSPATSFRLKNGVQIWGGYNVRTNSTGNIIPNWLINATRFINGSITTIEQGANSQAAFEVHEDLGNQTILNGLTIRGLNGISIINTQIALSFSAKVVNCSFDILNSSNSTAGIMSMGQVSKFAPTIVGSSFVSSSLSSPIHYSIEVYINSPDNLDVNISQTTFVNLNMTCSSGLAQNEVGNIVIDRCEFTDSNIGGRDTHLEISNSTFSNLNNSMYSQFFFSGVSELVVTNSTFLNNFMFPHIIDEIYENCIFSNTITNSFSSTISGSIEFKNCLLTPSIYTTNLISNPIVSMTNTIIANPQFVNTNPNSADYLKLSNSSPARNAGSNSFIPISMTRGLGGNSRILERTVDIGAYEFCPSLGACSSSNSHLPSRKITAAIQNPEINSIVYPNPATNVLNIKSESEIVSISLLNIQGQEVKKWNTKNELYIGDLPIGMYLLKVNTKEGTEHIRIIKE